MKEDSTKYSIVPSLNILVSFSTIIAFLAPNGISSIGLSKIQICLIIFSLLLLINYKSIAKLWRKISLRWRFARSLVFEYRRGHLDFLDKHGSVAMYNEENLIKKINKKGTFETDTEVDGFIDDEIQTFNCSSSLNNSKNIATIIYGRKNKDEDVLRNPRQLQMGYAITLKNCFYKQNESWGTIINHYTKVFDLKISFSKKNPPRNATIYQIYKNENGDFKEKNYLLTL